MMSLRRDTKSISPAPVVRSLPSKKAVRLRSSWFILGTLFGAALTYYVVSAIHKDPEYSRQFGILHAYTLLDASLTSLPALPAQAAMTPVAALPTAPVKQSLNLPATLTLSVERGDTLTDMLMDKGVSHEEALNIIESMKKVYNPKKLGVGQALELHLDKGKDNKPVIASLSIAVSPLKTIRLSRTEDDAFAIKEIKAPIFKGIMHAGGVIRSSLYQTGVDSGIPPQLLGEVIQALSYDVDFQRDIKEGDAIDVVYERMHTDKNVTAGYGNVLYASLTLGNKEVTLYRHASADGYGGYYTAKGESVKKALLRTPINGAHITSSFGMRMHPLLGYTKMHKGVDFGAVIGTPIYAAGDGVIEEAGRKGGYGNYVKVKHNNTYATAYAHASRFARGIHPGVHVKQGQVIAYVGSTGSSTGPHLHYEIIVNGAAVNPAGVKFRTGQTLQGRELASFKHEVKQVQTALATTPHKTQVAEAN